MITSLLRDYFATTPLFILNKLLLGTLIALLIIGLAHAIYTAIPALTNNHPRLNTLNNTYIKTLLAIIMTTILLLLPKAMLITLSILIIIALLRTGIREERTTRARFNANSSNPVDLHTLSKHIIMIDKDGIALNPRPVHTTKHLLGLAPRYQRLTKNAYQQHIQTVLNHIPENKHVVIFIHGGLNDYRNALMHAQNRLHAMQQDNTHPIFILWRSGLIPCYWSHLTEFRQGKRNYKQWYARIPLFIFTFTEDIARGFIRFPKTIITQLLSDYNALKPDTDNDAINMPELYKRLRIRHANAKNHIRIKKKDDDLNDAWNTGNTTLLLETLNPLKLSIRYLIWPIIDAFGTSAWDIMLRRTKTLYRSPDEFDIAGRPQNTYAPHTTSNTRVSVHTKALDSHPTGGLALFIQAFNQRTYQHTTLIGHSMGTIVANNWLRHAPDHPINTIVYMAAACTIEDATNALTPYLNTHPNTTFHNLTLHPKAERTEQHAHNLTPLGSLLEWIDNYFSKPLVFTERTLGKWDNVLQATHLFDESHRSRIHLKAFGITRAPVDMTDDEKACCPHGTPVKHGDFSHCLFWREAFYSVEG